MTTEQDHPAFDQSSNEMDQSPNMDQPPNMDQSPSEVNRTDGGAPSDAGCNREPADAPDAPPLTSEQEVALLRAALEEANEEIARQADAVQRGQADLLNARRRHDEERLTIQRQANSRLLVQLLPIIDELDLAVTHLETNGSAGAEPTNESWVQGVRLIQRKLGGFLESQGVTRIDTLGEPFNPELHEAVGMAKVPGAQSGCIVEVLRQGYRLHDRVVQVAQVVVNQ